MRKISVKRCVIAEIGIFMIAVGVSFNAMAQLGNDPVGIFYDGIRNALSLSQTQLGIASNLINIIFFGLLCLFGRKYIHIGTLLYVIPYGTFVSIGTAAYPHIFASGTLACRIVGSVTGCLLLYIGVGIYVAMEIGLDPMNGISLLLMETIKLDYAKTKWIFDGTMTAIGFLLGGKFGVVTLLTALTGGPGIQITINTVKHFMHEEKVNVK